MDSEDGQLFVKNLAYFVRTHERAFANALQLQRPKTADGREQAVAGAAYSSSLPSNTSLSASLTEVLARPYLAFSSRKPKPAKLTLTPHHLYFLLDRFSSELGVDVGPMNVRLENLNVESSSYMSFLGKPPKEIRRRSSDVDSLRSVSSVRSVMSSMSSVWETITLSNSTAKAEKQKAQYREDLRYLYSCFTKIPSLRLAPDGRARLIKGYEEFPFDCAVPLFVFKNVSSLEICDLDFRQFHGWDKLAEQLRSLTVRRAGLDDPIDLLQNIVLDDSQKRRELASRVQVPTTPSTPGAPWPTRPSPIPHNPAFALGSSISSPTTPYPSDRRKSLGHAYALISSEGTPPRVRQTSHSPTRPPTSRHVSNQRPQTSRAGTPKNPYRRSSGSSGSSQHEMTPRHSMSDLLAMGILPASKWRFLRHLSVAENGLTSLSVSSLAPVANTLQSLDLSSNLFSEVPDALASLTHLRALNLSNCMIDSLSSLSKNPLPAITTLNLRANRLLSLYGIERLYSLERLDLRDNRLHDPTELKRLTPIPDIRDLYVVKNPFTRTYSHNYRVTIFNLFRSTAGHVDDVNIDTMGPLYHEKKHLVDRVPEPANKPVIKPPPEDEGVDVSTAHSVAVAVQQGPSPRGHRRTTSDMGPPGSTTRRKRLPKRRVVELAQSEHRIVKPSEDVFTEPPLPDLMELPPMPDTPSMESDQPSTPEPTSYQNTPTAQFDSRLSLTVRPKLDTSFTSPTPPQIRDSSDDDTFPVRLVDDAGSDTIAYRQKIEALKSELGPNWLSALNEERFASSKERERSFSPASRSTIRPEHAARGVSVGGRALG